jgi:pimeloyl-ACP methyl ester carboxylesterase
MAKVGRFVALLLAAIVAVFNIASVAAAKQLAGYIDLTGSRGVASHATDNSGMFYWFTPAVEDDGTAPLVLWLQGGPGSSGMTGLFYEIGPYTLNDKIQMVDRTVGNWNQKYNVLFVDQPVGTGYSYAGSADAYANNEDDVTADLYFFLQQWYKQYSQYSSRPFFITGESYGGHYIPAFASRILDENANASSNHNLVVPLSGIAVGDGLTDPCSQVLTGPRAAYDFGIVDMKTYARAEAYAVKAAAECSRGNFSGAVDYRSKMEDAVIAASGINPYDVRVFGNYNANSEKMTVFLNEASTKDMLNVGQDKKFGTDSEVGEHLTDDIMRSLAGKFPRLLANMRVLLYQVSKFSVVSTGQPIDLIAG